MRVSLLCLAKRISNDAMLQGQDGCFWQMNSVNPATVQIVESSRYMPQAETGQSMMKLLYTRGRVAKKVGT